MTVQSIQNIESEHGDVFYMRKYSAEATIELPTATVNIFIKFSIETTPLGERLIKVQITDPVNYPMIPLKKALIEYIDNADLRGEIPHL